MTVHASSRELASSQPSRLHMILVVVIVFIMIVLINLAVIVNIVVVLIITSPSLLQPST